MSPIVNGRNCLAVFPMFRHRFHSLANPQVEYASRQWQQEGREHRQESSSLSPGVDLIIDGGVRRKFSKPPSLTTSTTRASRLIRQPLSIFLPPYRHDDSIADIAIGCGSSIVGVPNAAYRR
jgi:hypothetical protein